MSAAAPDAISNWLKPARFMTQGSFRLRASARQRRARKPLLAVQTTRVDTRRRAWTRLKIDFSSVDARRRVQSQLMSLETIEVVAVRKLIEFMLFSLITICRPQRYIAEVLDLNLNPCS
jgi:hypothetical protein